MLMIQNFSPILAQKISLEWPSYPSDWVHHDIPYEDLAAVIDRDTEFCEGCSRWYSDLKHVVGPVVRSHKVFPRWHLRNISIETSSEAVEEIDQKASHSFHVNGFDVDTYAISHSGPHSNILLKK